MNLHNMNSKSVKPKTFVYVPYQLPQFHKNLFTSIYLNLLKFEVHKV